MPPQYNSSGQVGGTDRHTFNNSSNDPQGDIMELRVPDEPSNAYQNDPQKMDRDSKTKDGKSLSGLLHGGGRIQRHGHTFQN